MAVAPATGQQLQPLVIGYSYRWADPLNLTPFCTHVSAPGSISGSTRDTASFSMASSEASRWLAVDDWVQIDLLDRDDGREHRFFGRVKSLDTGLGVMGDGGGLTSQTTITAVTWAEVLERFKKDARSFLQVNARDFRAGLLGQDDFAKGLFALATITASRGPDGYLAPPWVQVQILLHVLARYSGTMQQTFDLPGSFSPDHEPVSLIDIICKLTRQRYSASNEPLRPGAGDGGTTVLGGGAANFTIDRDDVNVAVAFDLQTPADQPWRKSAWQLCDWDETFALLDYYVAGNGVLDGVMQLQADGTLWAAMFEYADAPWTQLFCTLVEHIDWLGSKTTLTAHDGTEFVRDFLPTISFQPAPHPCYPDDFKQNGLLDTVAHKVVRADVRGYGSRPKVLLDIRGCTGASLSQSVDDLYTAWEVTPLDQAFKKLELWDAATLLDVSDGQIPIFDRPASLAHGYRPLLQQTKYFYGQQLDDGTATAFWTLLARKTALQYGWTIRGTDLVSGTITTKAFTANVARPGDVLVVTNHAGAAASVWQAQGGPADLVDQLDAASAQADILTGEPGRKGGAFACYVESVQLELALESGAWVSSVTLQVSHGQPVIVGQEIDVHALAGTLAHRFVDWSELDIDEPWYVLPFDPARDIAALLQEAALGEVREGVRGEVAQWLAHSKQVERLITQETKRHRTRPARFIPRKAKVPLDEEGQLEGGWFDPRDLEDQGPDVRQRGGPKPAAVEPEEQAPDDPPRFFQQPGGLPGIDGVIE